MTDRFFPRRNFLAAAAVGIGGALLSTDRAAAGAILDADFRLTHWPQHFYPTTPLPLASAAPGFTLDTARLAGWASQLAYEVGVAANEQMLRTILSGWGWRLRGLFDGPVQGFKWLRGARGYVAEWAGVTILGFSGTEPTQGADWAADFYFPPRSDDGIHRGFSDGVASVWDAVTGLIGAADGPADKRLFITGHSLGGALAAVTALRLVQAGHVDPARVQIVTLGMPRAGTDRFADAYRGAGLGGQTYRLVHGFDVVPQVPSYAGVGFRHVGNLLACRHGAAFRLEALLPDTPEATPPSSALSLRQSLGNTLESWKIDPATPDFPGGTTGRALPNLVRDHLTDTYLRSLGALQNS